MPYIKSVVDATHLTAIKGICRELIKGKGRASERKEVAGTIRCMAHFLLRRVLCSGYMLNEASIDVGRGRSRTEKMPRDEEIYRASLSSDCAFFLGVIFRLKSI